MVNIINTWAQKTVIVIIICTIIEMILPENKNKKYIKIVMGIYIVFIIISPIINKVQNKNIDLEKYFDLQNQNNQIMQTIAPIDTNTYIEEVYIDKIKTDIQEKLLLMGYKTKNIELKIETKDEKQYGEILYIGISLEQNKEENKIKINEIVISNNEENKTNILEQDENRIKKNLSEVYNINEDRIEVR